MVKDAVAHFLKEPVHTQILPAAPFYPAEASHQQYCLKETSRFQHYKASHRQRLAELWETRALELPLEEALKERLTPMQYHVTQEEGTEPPFENAYWDNKREGIYVDVVSGEPLFASSHKFESHSGWPSFTQPIEEGKLLESDDYKLGTHRTEVRCRKSDAHLGHVFPDGPGPTGLRYCINSSALRFIPRERLHEEGYGEFEDLFS